MPAQNALCDRPQNERSGQPERRGDHPQQGAAQRGGKRADRKSRTAAYYRSLAIPASIYQRKKPV